MTGPTAYGLPAPALITYAEAEAIGQEMHDRWEMLGGGDAPLERADFAWADLVQFCIRKADEATRARAA